MQVDFLMILFWLFICILTVILGYISFSVAKVVVNMMKIGFYWMFVALFSIVCFVFLALTICSGCYVIAANPFF